MEPSVRPTAANEVVPSEVRSPSEVRVPCCQRVGCKAEVGFVVRFETDALEMRVHRGSDGPAVARLCSAHAQRLRPPQGWTRVDVGADAAVLVNARSGAREFRIGDRAAVRPSVAAATALLAADTVPVAETPLTGSGRVDSAVVGPLLARALANTADPDAAARALFGIDRRAVG
jgi:hypothetical protein